MSGFSSPSRWRSGQSSRSAGRIARANSQLLWITHALLALWFIVAPLSEEVWLKEQYGEEYERYRREAPRFLRVRAKVSSSHRVIGNRDFLEARLLRPARSAER